MQYLRVVQRFVVCSVLLRLVSSVLSAYCQPHDIEQWSFINAHLSVNDSRTLELYVEAQPRLGDDLQRAAAFQARVAVVYNPSKTVGVYAGYAWTPQFYDSSYHRDYRDEQRLWQQLVYRQEGLGVTWLHRIREEQRFQTRTDGIGHRFRYMIRGAYPFVRTNDLGLAVFDEVMLNLNDVSGGARSGYDRNRFFIGPYWIYGSVHYEVGYLFEHLKRFGDNERLAHVLVASVMLKL
jgi:hypothetical protein